MSIEQEAIRAEAEAAAAEEAEKAVFEEAAEEAAAPAGPAFNIDLSWLAAKTGPGPISDYIDHPLNPSGSPALAQILRGVTGMAGDLDLAIVDIGIGSINLIKEKKTAKVVEHEPESNEVRK